MFERPVYNDCSAVDDWRTAAALASSPSAPLPFGAPRAPIRSLFDDEYSASPRSTSRSLSLFPPPSSATSSSSPWWPVSQSGFDHARRRSKSISKVLSGQVLHLEETPFGSATSHNSLGLEMEDHSAGEGFGIVGIDSRRSSYSSSADSLPGAFSMPVSSTARSSSTSLGLAFDDSEDLDFTAAFGVDEDREMIRACPSPRLIPIAIPMSPVPPLLDTLSLASPRKRRATLSLHTAPVAKKDSLDRPSTDRRVYLNTMPLPSLSPSPEATPAPSTPSGRDSVTPPPPPPSPTLLVFESLSLHSSDSPISTIGLPLGPCAGSDRSIRRRPNALGESNLTNAEDMPVKRRRLTLA